jgi:hypothetical protein
VTGRIVKHDHFGFEIRVPDGWAAARDLLGCALMLMELEEHEFRASVTVGVEEAPEPNLDALVTTQVGRLTRSLTDLEIVRRSEAELAGSSAHYLCATYREGIHEIQLEQWIIAIQKRAVAVAATVPRHRRDELSDAIRSAVESFRVG